MSLKCPACSSEIQKHGYELLLMPGIIYRCPVCRLELLLDRDGYEMQLAPLARDTAADRPPRKRRGR